MGAEAAESIADQITDRLTDQIAALAERVAALEAQHPVRSAVEPTAPTALGAPGEWDVALEERLRQRSGPEFELAGERGSVLYAGDATIAHGSYRWQMERPVPGLLAIPDELIARTLAAVASPIRVRLLKSVLRGAHEVAALQDALGGVSTGQLYHHLKELTAVGLLVQRARGRYEVSARNVVPLLAVIAAAYDLAGSGDQSSAPEEQTP